MAAEGRQYYTNILARQQTNPNNTTTAEDSLGIPPESIHRGAWKEAENPEFGCTWESNRLKKMFSCCLAIILSSIARGGYLVTLLLSLPLFDNVLCECINRTVEKKVETG